MIQLKAGGFGFLILFLISAGCATEEPKIPSQAIRERANQAFDELEREEAPHKASPREREGRKRPSETKPRGGVRITKGKRPDWVDGESIRYPSSTYLIGVGYGPDRQSAEDDARSEIAKIFTSEIASHTRTYEEYFQATAKGKSTQTESSNIEQITEVSTQKVISGVRIAQVYEETKPDPIFYALAVLDRDRSAAILRHRIQEIDQEIQRLLTRAEGEEDTLIRIQHLKQSIQKHLLREAYNSELRILSHSGGGIPPSIHFSEIKRELEAVLLRDFFIGLSIRGSRAEEVLEALVQGLNQQGFSVSEDVDRADVLVRGTVEIAPLDRGTPEWKYVQWRAHFDLVDQRGGRVFGSVNKTGREGHRSLAQAEDRAVRNLRKALATHIAREMTLYVFSQHGSR